MTIKKTNFNTLFNKLLFRYLLISIIIIVVLGFSIIYFFREFHYSQKENDIIRNSQIVENYISRALYLQDRPRIESWLQIIAKINTGQAWLIDNEGYLILSYPEGRTHFRRERIRFLHYQKIFEGEVVSEQIEIDHFEEPMLLIGIPIRFFESIDYGLLIFTPVSGIKNSVDQVKRLMFYSSLFAILLGGLLAYTWSHSLSKPLKKMSDFAISLGDGDFGKTINVNESLNIREINKLSESINYMSSTLKSTIDDLREERNKLKYILSGMNEGVLAINTDKKVILINHAARELLNLNNKEVSQKKLNMIIDNENLKEMFAKVLNNNEFYADELFFTINGVKKRILIHLNPIYIEENELWGIVALFQDISERWRFEKLQREFITNISHDLKTPLSSIKGASEALLDDILPSPEKEKEYLEMILEESNRLEALVEDILNIEKFEEGNLNFKMEKVEVNELLNSVKNVFEKIIDKNNSDICLKTIIPDEKLYVRGSLEKLKQVLLNLLDNAYKFSSEKGFIELGVIEQENRIKFWVKDEGKGIPQDEVDNIWERFYKIDKSRTPDDSGSGLGLAIVKQIINKHDGEIFVKNSENQGAVFGFYLDQKQ